MLVQRTAPLRRWHAAAGTGHEANGPQCAPDQVVRRLACRPHRTQCQVGVAPGQAEQPVGRTQLHLQQRVCPGQCAKRRQDQAAQHRIGGGQAHAASDCVTCMQRTGLRGLQLGFYAFSVTRQGLGGVAWQVALAGAFKQALAQLLFNALQHAEHGGRVRVQPCARGCQCAAAHQCQHDLEVSRSQRVLRFCNDWFQDCVLLLLLCNPTFRACTTQAGVSHDLHF
jgi:hypothetical protein